MNERISRKVNYDKVLRVNLKPIPQKPGLKMASRAPTGINDLGGGAETTVFDAILDYDSMSIPSGLVFKKLRSGDIGELREALSQWRRIREVASLLKKAGKETFNLPATVRGVYGKKKWWKMQPAVAGILMTDLAEVGRNEIIDAKFADRSSNIGLEQWRIVRREIERDLEIATGHDIRLASGFRGLDPWVVVRNKQTGECHAYIVDIGRFTRRNIPYRNTTNLLAQQTMTKFGLQEITDSIEKREAPRA